MKIKYVLPFILTTLGCAGVNSQSSPLLKAPPPAHVESPELQKASPNNAQIAWRPLSESTMLEAKTNKKFMFVVFKTSWCEFCKKLETELTDPKISAFVNENFIPVVVQDDDSTILFSLTGDPEKVAYPTMMIFDYHEDMPVLMVYQGLLSSEDLMKWLGPPARVSAILRDSEK